MYATFACCVFTKHLNQFSLNFNWGVSANKKMVQESKFAQWQRFFYKVRGSFSNMHKHRRYNQFCANGHAGLRSVYLTVPSRVYYIRYLDLVSKLVKVPHPVSQIKFGLWEIGEGVLRSFITRGCILWYGLRLWHRFDVYICFLKEER